MPKRNTRLGEETDKAWRAYCAAYGKTSSELIREFIESKVAAETPPVMPSVIRKEQPKYPVKIFITESERAGVDLRRKLNGGTRAGWYIKVSRAALARCPVLESPELSLLESAVTELNFVGRNFNQCVRRLHEGMENHGVDTKIVERVEARVISIEESIKDLLRANRTRWDIRA